jgi:hypothetical protein
VASDESPWMARGRCKNAPSPIAGAVCMTLEKKGVALAIVPMGGRKWTGGVEMVGDNRPQQALGLLGHG